MQDESRGLPPDAIHPTVEARYYWGNGGWGPAPALSLRCRTCQCVRESQASGHSADKKTLDLETAKMWMRRQCPRVEADCRVSKAVTAMLRDGARSRPRRKLTCAKQ